jgi:predicted pyridoxine 5'-phosphate oxidase superfamily flavin-nucleotide-binding protein
MSTYGAIAYTSSVRDAQLRLGSPVAWSAEDPDTDYHLGPEEAKFISGADGFFQATVSETGWPYVQFRGGPPGFVHVLGGTSIGYADLRGNRQYISVGNLAHDNRVALFFVDYASRRRLKLFGRALLSNDDAILEVVAQGADRGRVERAVLIDVVAGAWNCPQHITPRWTEREIAAVVDPLRARIAELEAQLADKHRDAPNGTPLSPTP